MITDDIRAMVYRLHQHDIPISRLSYELDESEWENFRKEMEGLHANPDIDLSYMADLKFMGLGVRKRASTSKPEAK